MITATGLLACGPWLPEQILIGRQVVLRTPVGDFAQEVRALDGPGDAAPALPPGMARAEEAVKINSREYGEKGPPEQLKVELDEMGEVLAQAKIEEPRRGAVLAAYEAWRRPKVGPRKESSDDSESEDTAPFDEQAAKARQEATGATPDPSADAQPKLPADLMATLSAEWIDYLQGADCFANGNLAGAQAAWERLLARPQTERTYRSVWAAFMLARTRESGEAKPAENAARYQRVRELRAAGCRDGLNLAAASLGWEARLALREKDYSAAARLYYQQGVAGRIDGDSLRIVAAAALGEEQTDASATFVNASDPTASAAQGGKEADDSAMTAAARDPFLRRVATLYLACHRRFGDDYESSDESKKISARWLAALGKADVDAVHEAAGAAWAAYQLGDYAGAASWLKLAPAEQPLALWLRAKLALRDGKNDEAARDFARAVHAYPVAVELENPVDSATELAEDGQAFRNQQFQLDFGIVQLARGDFQQAFTSLLRSGFWTDAAYVAERVLTPQELERYVRDKYPQAPAAKPDAPPASTPDPSYRDPWQAIEYAVRANADRNQSTDPTAFSLRYLLARRLARLGRYADARRYYPAALLPKFDEYVAARKLGESSAPKAKRADALWRAAMIHRVLGMELFGTEAGPDWSVEEGDFEMDDYRQFRAGDTPWLNFHGAVTANTPRDPTPEHDVPWVPPIGAGEKKRLAKSEVQPDERYHYRYVAADLAWKAAALMPDQQEETAKVLATGGRWLESVDATKAADRFYIALLRRCGKTELGRAADKSGRMPDVEPN